MNQRIVILAAALGCCFWASAQNGNSSGGTQSNSNAGATANVYQQGAEAPRQFPTAYPGGVAGPFPGFSLGNSPWTVACPAVYQAYGWTKEVVDIMKRAGGGKNIFKPSRWHVVPMTQEKSWKGDHAIRPICWSPYEHPAEAGEVLAVMEGIGDFGWPEERYVAELLASGRVPEGTYRIAIIVRSLNKTVTNSRAYGVGVTGGIATNADTKGGAAALGVNFGKTTVQVIDPPQIKIICLGAGPLVVPLPLAPPQTQVAQETPPAAPATTSVALPQVVKVQVEIAPIEIKPIDVTLNLPPKPFPELTPPPAPAPTLSEVCDVGGGLPELTVYFDFDKSLVKSGYTPKLIEYVGWLNAHPKCHIQVEGHTCRSGTFDYDAALGRRRAKAVYDALIVNGGEPEQIEQSVSVSKDRLASEYEAPNRRAILRIIGSASGK